MIQLKSMTQALLDAVTASHDKAGATTKDDGGACNETKTTATTTTTTTITNKDRDQDLSSVAEHHNNMMANAFYERSLSMSSSESSSIASFGVPPSPGACGNKINNNLPSSLTFSCTNHDSGATTISTDDEAEDDIVSCATLDTAKDVAVPISKESAFKKLRVTYLLITLAIMLADGLQGTHLYVLYEDYGYSVASLYCLGFVTGGLLSPVTGPLIDKIGRKKAAILYCLLEIFINKLEQFPILIGLIASRMIGGFTTNLLSTVFEAWLITEYRQQGLAKEKYEIIMRDSVIVSNTAAIMSGYLAHVLAEYYGAVGPFQGAVSCTTIALVVVTLLWNENYGDDVFNDETEDSVGSDSDDKSDTIMPSKSMTAYMQDAISAFRSDSKMLRVGILQGLTTGCIHIFIFLWAPALRELAIKAPATSWGLDQHNEPAYGLIFGAFMAAGVFGGFAAPWVRKSITFLLTPPSPLSDTASKSDSSNEGEATLERQMAVELLAGSCYMVSAVLMVIPCIVSANSPTAFTLSLGAFLLYEVLIGVFLPCEGVIRSLYFPANARGSVMALPRIIVNVAVAIGVALTNYVSLRAVFTCVSFLFILSSGLQLSLISRQEWHTFYDSLCKLPFTLLYNAKQCFGRNKKVKEL